MSATDKKHIVQTLKSLQKDLFDQSARNPLVQTDLTKLWFTESESDFKSAEKIYSKAKFFEKEYALKTTLHVEAFLKWKNQGTGNFSTSPLLYKPATLSKKTREEISFSTQDDESVFTINPVLRKLMLEQFQLDLPETVTEAEQVYILLENEFSKIERVQEFNSTESWQLVLKKAAGIFNYKKLLLANDYDKITSGPDQSIESLFGEKKFKTNEIPESHFLHDLDNSQKDAVQTSLADNVVIQGPPGTGKSHTVANLIKSFLIQNKKVLFVSEKRAALDVVFQKLKKDKLDLRIAYFNSDKNEKKQFYAHLKKNWEKTNSLISQNTLPIPSKPKFNDLLEFYPAKLKSIDEQDGSDIFMLEEKLLACNLPDASFEIIGQTPRYKIWSENFDFLEEFEIQICELFKTSNVQKTAFIHLNSTIFSDTNPLQRIQLRLSQLEKHIQTIQEVCSLYKLNNSLTEIIHLSIAASILNMVNKNQLDLLQQENKKYKAFSTLAKKYQLVKIKLQQAEQLNQKWTKKPGISEITELTDLLKQKKKSKSILSILKRNSARSLDYFSDFSPEISTVTKLQLLEEVRSEWHLRNDLDELKIKLKHELHIQNPDTEIDHILQVRTKLQSISSNDYVKILEHPDSLQLIRDFDKLHGILNQLSGIITYLGIHPTGDSLPKLQTVCNQLKREIPKLENLQTELKNWFKLPVSVLDFVRKNVLKINELNTCVFQYHLNEKTRFEPKYKMLSGESLLTDFRARSRNYKVYNSDLHGPIQSAPAVYLKRMERLSETSTSRLKENQKAERKIYKDAKRILTHELNKTQRHLPVLELMSGCKDLVFSMQPVWMMNPLSVSQYLPCDEALFDVVIFDEASQIPLEDSIPAIYRGAQLIVAGDSQQMPPGKFFSSNSEGKTLLDQASFNLQNKMLTHHYRSAHPSLISFSNAHFYDNELLALPPCTDSTPIELIKTQGIFEDNKNIAEAKSIAQYYKTLLINGKKDIGIIAFSQAQQLEIERQIDSLKLPENDLLLVRNLENIQGNEKDIILISVGYAKNKEGLFRKNFGPLNQERGANRLNVMLTRAIHKMVVFTSVNSSDFGLSDNRGVTLLADFLKFAERFQIQNIQTKPKTIGEEIVYDFLTKKKLNFEYYSRDAGLSISAFVNPKSGNILLVNPCHEGDSDLYTTLGALEKRFDEIMIVVNTDLISDRKNTESRLKDFFK